MSLTEILTAILTILGAFFMFTAALGVLRMPDIYTRLPAAQSAYPRSGFDSVGVGIYSNDWAV